MCTDKANAGEFRPCPFERNGFGRIDQGDVIDVRLKVWSGVERIDAPLIRKPDPFKKSFRRFRFAADSANKVARLRRQERQINLAPGKQRRDELL